jgi:GST-like protein
VLEEMPHVARWLDAVLKRPAVMRGLAVGAEKRDPASERMKDPKVQEVLFGNKPA